MLRVILLAVALSISSKVTQAQEYSCDQVKSMVNKVGGLAKARKKAEDLGFSRERINHYIKLCFKGKQ